METFVCLGDLRPKGILRDGEHFLYKKGFQLKGSDPLFSSSFILIS
jgi:hypothetical protein